ncbi:hypothetical protein SLS58_007956 [Diplodia intermedia]|uniref:Heterokaryon incompatibility domain-containing protein n=1 Tax=Diplodia intermedia TaxID=856260 RepID=A0ABR3TJ43_9PEZI
MSFENASPVEEETSPFRADTAPGYLNGNGPEESVSDGKDEGTEGCDTCGKINSVLEQKILEDHISDHIGLVNDLLRSDCHLHKPLLDWLSKELEFHESRGVPAPKDAPYLALSYVWGKVETVNTAKSNLDQLQESGSLQHLMEQRKIPRTIRQAIQLAQSLNERYLWVDSLCIVQDDYDMLKDQLNRMSSIFAHANAVIMPIDGVDADYGLRGLKGSLDQEERQIKQLVLPFGDKTLLKRHEIGEQRRTPHKKQQYFDRAWTFQEYHFARRRICFEEDSVWFQCCRSTHYEDHRRPELPDGTRDWTFDVGYPALNVYSDMIQDFNRRQLSFPEDCLSAVAGMLSCYTKAFKGGFLCGLPEMFFDVCLLWQPAGDLERRVPSNASTLSPAAEPCLPTWSWAGWHGPVDFDDWATGNDWIAACRGRVALTECQIFPITEWYTGDDPSGAGKRRIDVEWCAWRERYKDQDRELPSGWTKELRDPEIPLTSTNHPDGYGEYLYNHESCNASFWFPIPLSDPDSQPRMKPNTRYIFGSVQTVTLYTLGAVSAPPDPGNDLMSARGKCPRISLCNAQNEWAGVLRLHSRDYLEKKGLHPVGAKHAVQLIALSRGSIPNALDYGAYYLEEYYMEGRPKQGENYEYYNVMWIICEAGIARREAVGRVHRGMWESLEPIFDRLPNLLEEDNFGLASGPFPRGFSGGTLSHFPTINYYTSPFAQVVQEYTARSDIRLNYSGCVGACDTHVEAPGFDVSCTRGKRPYNYKPYGDDGDYSKDVGKDHYAGSTAVEFSGREDAGTVHVNVEYKTDSTNCTGDFTTVNCTLHIATVLYLITLRNRVATLMPAGTNDTIELQDILYEEPGLGLKPSTIGGIADAASKVFDSSVSFDNEGPGYAATGQGRMANMHGKLQLSDSTASVGCDNLTWSDPTPDVVGALRELTFRSAIAASNASTVQRVSAVDSYRRTVYVSHYRYLAAALGVVVADALAVLPLFVGWWALGRRATMSPLELAKAFQSPLTSSSNQNEIKGLLESLGGVRTRRTFAYDNCNTSDDVANGLGSWQRG